MSITHNWTDILDELICEAINAGRVEGDLSGKPDEKVESGLAHIFFYGDTVYKLYKTHADKDHFIKGVLAPTTRRKTFLEHDFSLNQHFSGEVYKKMHSVSYQDGFVTVGSYDGSSIYTLIEMNRLDFDTNLHERLLRGEINPDELFVLGYEIAHAIDTCPIKAPDDVSWYDLASERVGMLRQFLDWLDPKYGELVRESGVLEVLREHLEEHRDEYILLRGEELTVNIDNHDENVFFVEGKSQFIDLLPPMGSWWYGVPYANLANVVANVEALHSNEAAEQVRLGYIDYYQGVEPPAHTYGFTKAFAYLISIAHFGSVPGKEGVAEKYLARIGDIPAWLNK